MVLYDLTKVKSILGETGTTNDLKIRNYGDMADSVINGDLVNVKDLPNPPVVTVDVLTQKELDQIQSFATQLTIGYFYKFESGDTLTVEETKANWQNWFNSKFRRPRFKVRGGELAR
jgi:hypothetical protein